MNRFNSSNSSSNHHFNNEKSSHHNSLYKTYSPYPTSTSALDLLATSQDPNSVVDDIVPQVNDTYGIYHNHHQQPRGNHNNDLNYGQEQQHQQQQRQEHSHNPSTTSTTNVKSEPFLTDYSTANTNNNQDSVQKRTNYRQNQDQQGK